jgi:hypothetical protein
MATLEVLIDFPATQGAFDAQGPWAEFIGLLGLSHLLDGFCDVALNLLGLDDSQEHDGALWQIERLKGNQLAILHPHADGFVLVTRLPVVVDRILLIVPVPGLVLRFINDVQVARHGVQSNDL